MLANREYMSDENRIHRIKNRINNMTIRELISREHSDRRTISEIIDLFHSVIVFDKELIPEMTYAEFISMIEELDKVNQNDYENYLCCVGNKFHVLRDLALGLIDQNKRNIPVRLFFNIPLDAYMNNNQNIKKTVANEDTVGSFICKNCEKAWSVDPFEVKFEYGKIAKEHECFKELEKILIKSFLAASDYRICVDDVYHKYASKQGGYFYG